MGTVAILAQELNLSYNKKKKPTTHHPPLVRPNMNRELAYAETICNRAMTIIYICCDFAGLEPDDLIENEIFVLDISNYISSAAEYIDGGKEVMVDYENVRSAALYISVSVRDNRVDDIPALAKIKSHFMKMDSGGEIVDTFDESYRVKKILNDPHFEHAMNIDWDLREKETA